MSVWFALLTVIVLGFIDHFGNETFHIQINSVSHSTENTSGCAVIASDFTYCQSENFPFSRIVESFLLI